MTIRIEQVNEDLVLTQTRPPMPPAVDAVLPPVAPSQSRELRDSLIGIGALLELEERRPLRRPESAASGSQVGSQRVRKPREYVLLFAAALTLFVVGLIEAPWPTSPPLVPPALLGEWTTTNPDYAEARLMFTETDVMLQTQFGVRPARNRIVSLKARVNWDSTAFVLTYLSNGAPVEMHATLVETLPGKLVFLRPDGLIWTRGPDALPR